MRGKGSHTAVLAMLGAVVLGTAPAVAAQRKSIEPDLLKLADTQGLRVFNRTVSGLRDGVKRGVRLSEHAGIGVAYVPGVEFTNGTIEFDVRGKDVLQQSFVGVAFHGIDETTYDAVYFRPFNFRAADSTRRAHAVQYVAEPAYPWDKLRAEHPGVYEQPVSAALDPNGWFHARVVVAGPTVSVLVGDATRPSLVVKRLSERGRGLIGLWVGNTSGGDFANLKITPE